MAYNYPTEETAFGRSGKQRKLALDAYTRIFSQYREMMPDNGNAKFRQLLLDKFPKVYGWMLTKNPHLGRMNLGHLFQYIFPTPKCPHCKQLLTKVCPRHIYCSVKCRNLHLLGVEHHLQSPEIIAKRDTTCLVRYGAKNVSQVQEFKDKKVDTCLSNHGVAYPQQSADVRQTTVTNYKAKTGYEHPLQNPEVMERLVATNLRVRKVRNVSQDPKVKRSKQDNYFDETGYLNPSQNPDVKDAKTATCLKNYGVDNPFQSTEIIKKIEDNREQRTGFRHPRQDPKVVQQVSKKYFKKTGYSYPAQNPDVREKAKATNIAKRGVAYPLQDPTVYAKVARSSFRVTDHVIHGRSFSVQSHHEKWQFEKLVAEYGITNAHTQFHEEFPKEIFQKIRTHPDLYIETTDKFFEVKCLWTLLSDRDFERNQAKAKRCHESDVVVQWVVVDPTKNWSTELPQDWYKWSKDRVAAFVEAPR